MGKLRGLSGEEVWQILLKHGFRRIHQRGSHIVMQKNLVGSTITVPVPVPDHGQLKNRYINVNYPTVRNLKK